jgi:hypothetical protein
VVAAPTGGPTDVVIATQHGLNTLAPSTSVVPAPPQGSTDVVRDNAQTAPGDPTSMATSAIVPLNDVRARTSSTARPAAELPSNAQYVVINDCIAPPEVLDNLQEHNVRHFTKAYMIRQEQMDH